MNDDIMRQAGLGHMVDKVHKGVCPTCDTKDAKSTIKADDKLSLKEFKISGMCQACQDSVFNGE